VRARGDRRGLMSSTWTLQRDGAGRHAGEVMMCVSRELQFAEGGREQGVGTFERSASIIAMIATVSMGLQRR
jgi:hypothetical protein